MIQFVVPFASYNAAQKSARSFSVTVELKSGKTVTTDSFPNEGSALADVCEMIAHAMEQQTYFTLWCRAKKAIVTVAVSDVSTVSISLNS